MASSVLVLVGEAKKIVPELLNRAKALKMGSGLATETAIGPVISAAHRQKIIAAIENAESEGGRILLDGRHVTEEALQFGNFIAATIIETGNSNSALIQQEIFGPVLAIMYADNLEEAITLSNCSLYGNGASIFTRSGGAAEKFRRTIECGMIGINAGVPAPMAYFSFGGRKQSFFGDLKIQGRDAVEFYTMKKSVISRWPDLKSGSIWAK